MAFRISLILGILINPLYTNIEATGPTVFPRPDLKVLPSTHFSCTVTPIESGGPVGPELDSFVYETTPNYANRPDYGHYNGALRGWTASYTNFVLEQNTDISIDPTKKDPSRVTKPVKVKIAILGDWLPAGTILNESNVEIRPNSLAGKAYKNLMIDNIERTVEFTVMKPANLSVEINGYPNVSAENKHHSMCVFANPPLIGEFAPPEEDSPNIIYIEPGEGELPIVQPGDTLYFKPGLHKIPVLSPIVGGVNYYIPGGAYVQGTFIGRRQHNVKFWGYGIISGKDIPTQPSKENAPKLLNNWGGGTKDFTLQGITFEDAPYHTMTARGGTREKPLRFINYKTMNWKPSTDAHSTGGFVLVDGCFFRCQDDNIYTAGSRNGGVIRRTAFWNDANACAFLFTSQGSGGNVTVEDCDVIRNHSYILNGKLSNVFNIRKIADNQTIDNLHFKNIRVEDYRKLLIRVKLEDLAHATPTGITIRDVSFKNLIVDNHHEFYEWNDWSNGVLVKRHREKTCTLHGSPAKDCELLNIVCENVSFEGRDAEYSDFDIQDADVIVRKSTGTSLPVGWLNRDITNSANGEMIGSATYKAPKGVTLFPDRNTKGIFSVSTSEICERSVFDRLHMAYKRVEKEEGATTVMAQIKQRVNGAHAGITLRDDLDPSSKNVACFWEGDSLCLYSRQADGELTSKIAEKELAATSVYLKIVRLNDTYAAAYSTTGEMNDWHLIGETVVPGMANRLYFGLACCSLDNSLSRAEFSHVSTIPKMMEY
jgi:hypothetical protein